ncbi:Condensin complex subunit 2 [Acorus gramineus]|uniref:Condensin complex subunit 2 n=1 Tax=Acorus gramineus TaxID=55184 RepID=A0AAV9A4A3_ACOGR|nr:Condensin complex subunit 2 [Acorus gramineus]
MEDRVVTPIRSALQSRLLSPMKSPPPHLLISSNDDRLERAQAQAARSTAAKRRESLFTVPHAAATSSSSAVSLFSRDQIMELFQNCIKLASENKINQKNTWELGLIDHISEIIRVESEDHAETNFQKASCTIEAGVKIYALRVDSAHSEAYKVICGINRAGREDDGVDVLEDTQESKEGITKKESEKKMSPLSTLESSFEALNIKKFDVAFTVDPLYHQTSAQFDEGGARGLLLNNLGVYGGCRVLFDSIEAPGKNMLGQKQNCETDLLDCSFVKDCIEQMTTHLPMRNAISSSLKDILGQSDDYDRSPSVVSDIAEATLSEDDGFDSNQVDESEGFVGDHCGPEVFVGDDCGPCGFDREGQTCFSNGSSPYIGPDLNGHREENNQSREPDTDDGFDKIVGFLSLGTGFVLKANAWAGPDHWKFRKPKELEETIVSTSGSVIEKKKPQRKIKEDIDFTKSLDQETSRIVAKSKSLRANRVPCNTVLPEDCHYQPEQLVKPYLPLNCISRKRSEFSDEPEDNNHAYDAFGEWNNENMGHDEYDGGNLQSDEDDSNSLVTQPRQTTRIEVQYDKSSKQVDVHALKGTLWNCLQKSAEPSGEVSEAAVSFRDLVEHFPENCPAAEPKDISPHLCFICLLHLANEHSLSIRDCPTLDDLRIYNIPNMKQCI